MGIVEDLYPFDVGMMQSGLPGQLVVWSHFQIPLCLLVQLKFKFVIGVVDAR